MYEVPFPFHYSTPSKPPLLFVELFNRIKRSQNVRFQCEHLHACLHVHDELLPDACDITACSRGVGHVSGGRV